MDKNTIKLKLKLLENSLEVFKDSYEDMLDSLTESEKYSYKSYHNEKSLILEFLECLNDIQYYIQDINKEVNR